MKDPRRILEKYVTPPVPESRLQDAMLHLAQFLCEETEVLAVCLTDTPCLFASWSTGTISARRESKLTPAYAKAILDHHAEGRVRLSYVEDNRESGIRVTRGEGLAEWWTAALEADGDWDKVEIEGKKIGVAPRRRLFRQWYDTEGERTYHSHAAIRDKWNALPLQERKQICPANPNHVTRATVIQDIRRTKT